MNTAYLTMNDNNRPINNINAVLFHFSTVLIENSKKSIYSEAALLTEYRGVMDLLLLGYFTRLSCTLIK